MSSFYVPTPQAYQPPSSIICKYCNSPIFVGDRAVYFHHGIVGRGQKSGQPIVTDGSHTSGESVVHELCAPGFLTTEIVDCAEEVESVVDSITADIFGKSYSDMAMEESLCVACGTELDE